MIKWQRRARFLIAVFAVAFAVVVVLAFKQRATGSAPVSVARTDPNALVESTDGRVMRFKREHEDVSVEYERQLTYANGSTKLIGVKVRTDDRGGGRTFTVTAKDGQVGQNESVVALDGDVKLVASDGFTARTEHATYAETDGVVRAPGPVEFSHNRLSGAGIGMTYDKNSDIFSILDQAILHMAPDSKGGGAAEVASGVAIFARRDKIVQFDRGLKVQRAGQILEAPAGTAHLTPDEKRIETIELRGGSRITGSNTAAGGLQALTGHEMTLKYAADGQALEHVLVTGDAVIQVAGEAGKAGRQITAQAIDVTLAPDGSTPTSLFARDSVLLTLPAESGAGVRTIRAASLEANGEPGRGLTRAQFSGSVQFRERRGPVDRGANSDTLDMALTPAMSAIEDAKFAGAVRYAEGSMTALASHARYQPRPGLLELTGEPAGAVPHVVNDQISVDAKRIDVTLEGPKMHAVGDVKSVLQPPKKGAQKDAGGKAADAKLPSMLKQDQPVNVTGETLDYDGTAARATYTGRAQLWQGETSVRADTVFIDDKTGDLTASGSVVTSVVLEQVDQDKKKERVRSVATAKDFKYEDAVRRATYTGDAHLSGPQGDMTAAKIHLYLKPSGDELDRAEAFDGLTLREQNRKTTGSQMTYTSADERYVVTGAPVTIVDQCGRETIGKTLTFLKATDTIDVDGNERIRTQTKGGSSCP